MSLEPELGALDLNGGGAAARERRAVTISERTASAYGVGESGRGPDEDCVPLVEVWVDVCLVAQDAVAGSIARRDVGPAHMSQQCREIERDRTT